MRKSIGLFGILVVGALILASPQAFAQTGSSGNNAAGPNGTGSNNTNTSGPASSGDGYYHHHMHSSEPGSTADSGYDPNSDYHPDTGADIHSNNARQARPSGSGGENSGTAAPMSGPNR